MQDKSFSSAVSGLVLHSPAFLFISMILSFVLMFVVQMFYYSQFVFAGKMPVAFCWAVGIAIGLMVQLSRLAFGIAGASDFAKGRISRGLSGMLFSLGLAILGSYEVNEIVATWSKSDSHGSTMLILQSIVWLGFLLEIRIAIAVGGELKKQDIEKHDIIFSSNGTAKSRSKS